MPFEIVFNFVIDRLHERARGRGWQGESEMSMYRDRWPAILSLEQEQILRLDVSQLAGTGS